MLFYKYFFYYAILLLSFIHINIFSTTNQTYIMINFNHLSNKGQFSNLDFNIIFILSHPSNHSQTSTKFTLNSLTFIFNPLKVNKTRFTLYSTWIDSLPLPPINVEGERGRKREIHLFFNHFILCNGLRVVSRLELSPQFFFPA